MKRTRQENKHLNLRLILISIVLCSCGVNVGNPDEPDEQSESFTLTEIEADETVALPFNQILEKISRTLRVIHTGKYKQEESTCESIDGKIKVVTSVDKTMHEDLNFKRRMAGIRVAKIGNSESLYFNHGGNISCSENGELTIDWQKIVSFEMTKEYSFEKTHSVDRNPRNSETNLTTVEGNPSHYFNSSDAIKKHFHQHSSSGSGTLSALWEKQNLEDGQYKTIVTVHIDSTKSRTGKSQDKLFSLNATIKTTNENPLITESFFDEGGVPISHSILKGEVESSNNSGVKMNSTFENLTFTKDHGCHPQSGRVIGDILAPDGGVFAPYRLLFTEGNSDLSHIGDRKIEVNPDYCDFDRWQQ